MAALRFFEAWQVRRLNDSTGVAASPASEVLHLESLRHAELPDFARASSLQHVQIDNLPLVDGLTGLAAAPQLRQLLITRRLLHRDELDALRDHPTLEAAYLPLRGRQVSEDDLRLGLRHRDRAPFDAYAAGVMGLPALA